MVEEWLFGVVAVIYLAVSIGELSFYLGEVPGFWRFLARFSFAVEVAPWPGLTVERMRGFRREAPNAIMVFDESSRTLFARRRHGLGNRRMPAVVIVEFEGDEPDSGLSVKARWGFVPFLGLMTLMLVCASMWVPWGGVDRSIPWFALVAPMAMMSVVSAVVFILARSSANTVLNEVECEVMALLEASRLKEQARQ